MLACEVLGLTNQKEYLEKYYTDIDLKYMDITKLHNDQINKLKDALQKEKDKNA